MSYYSDEKYSTVGIDYDLYTCLEYNPQEGYTVDDIDRVLAVYEGENDGYSWRWILKLKRTRNKYVFLQGWCDYTGWECQSSAFSEFESTALKAAQHALDQSSSSENAQHIRRDLNYQIKFGKCGTWREQQDIHMGMFDATIQT